MFIFIQKLCISLMHFDIDIIILVL